MNRRCDPNSRAFPAKDIAELVNAGIDVGGLTKREYFAGLVLQGMSAHPQAPGEFLVGGGGRFAELAVDVADALIAELNNPVGVP